MSGEEALLSEVDAHGVRTLTFNRPDKANALNAALVDAAHRRLDAIGDETRVLVVTGAGKHFCGGFDFGGYDTQSEGDLLLRFVRINALLARLRGARYLTVADVHGAAYGAGADIVCCCAVRLAAPGSRFRFPGFQFGVALGTRSLAHLVGATRAREILSRNEELDAQGALACGMLSAVLADDERQARIRETAASVGRLEPEALGSILTITEPDTADADLADLVRSLVRPGLHERIARYRGGAA